MMDGAIEWIGGCYKRQHQSVYCSLPSILTGVADKWEIVIENLWSCFIAACLNASQGDDVDEEISDKMPQSTCFQTAVL